MKVYIGGDHRGFEIKEKIKTWLSKWKYDFEDMGAFYLDPDDDYVVYATKVAQKIQDEQNDKGILICGSGVGVEVVANKFDKVRAAIGKSTAQVKAGRNDDDMNVLVIAADYTKEKEAKEMVKIFLKTKFGEKARFKRRLDEISQIENKKDVHGSASVWSDIFEGNDVAYSETPQTQNQLFDLTKISFLEEIFPAGKKKMVEVGCGSAYVSLYFAKKGYEATCLDINKEILAIAKGNFEKENTKGEFVLASAEKLPFKDNTYDVVSSFGLMEHFEDPSIAFAEMVRVLKPGGLFFGDIVPNRFSVQTFGNIFNFLVTLPFSPAKAMRNFRPLYFESNLSWQTYKKLIEETGIKKVEVRGNRPWPRLTMPKSLDKIYTKIMLPSLFLWKKFDRWDNGFPRWWGAGLWFWGVK